MALSNALVQANADDRTPRPVMSVYMMEFGVTNFGIFLIAILAGHIGVQWATAGRGGAALLAVMTCTFSEDAQTSAGCRRRRSFGALTHTVRSIRVDTSSLSLCRPASSWRSASQAASAASRSRVNTTAASRPANTAATGSPASTMAKASPMARVKSRAHSLG